MRILNKPITVLYLLFSIVVISIAFQNCSSPFEANTPNGSISGLNLNSDDQSTVNEIKSLAIFEKTLYEDIQTNCASCHGVNQKPLFAVANSLDSHRLLFNKEYINLENPENSYLAIKIRAGHNNFPVTLAETFTAKITDWSNQLLVALEEVPQSEDPEDPQEEAPVEGAQPEEEEAQPEETPEDQEEGAIEEPKVAEEETFSFIHQAILVPKCLNCHKPVAAGGLGLKDDYTDYTTTLAAGGSVVAGDSAASTMYSQVLSGKMPPGNPLSAEEIELIKNWIDKGAKN